MTIRSGLFNNSVTGERVFMKKFQYNDFIPHDVWLICRLDTQVADQAADIYLLMELPEGLIHAHAVTLEEGLNRHEAEEFFKTAYAKVRYLPKRIFIIKGDPIEHSVKDIAAGKSIIMESHPASAFEDILAPLKESFGQHFFSPSTVFHAHAEDDVHPDDIESAKQSIPEPYDPCPCASGKKYKFCCKPIFREIMGAMTEAQDGKKDNALKYIAEAKKRVGETGEVLCREAIVYGFFDDAEYEALLDRCLALFPKHPRANYVKGLLEREKENFPEAIIYYKRAIENYPRTDRYHLNEAYNNIGTVYYELKDYGKAKSSWEQALFLLPSDRTVKRNLIEFIFSNPQVPEALREMSPIVERLLAGVRS